VAAGAYAVLARFPSTRGFFGTVLHQFLSAETVQVSEEGGFFRLLRAFFLHKSW
jgi:hypothetical protein